jgi:hypothetical protein
MIALSEYSIYAAQSKAVVALALPMHYNGLFRVGKLWMASPFQNLPAFQAAPLPLLNTTDPHGEGYVLYLFIY